MPERSGFFSSSRVPRLFSGDVLDGVYFGIVAVAVLLGLWHNSITAQEYVELFKSVGSVSHPF